MANSPQWIRSSLLVVSLSLPLPAFAEGPGLKAASDALQQAQQHFAQCKNGKLQAEFGTALSRLESARKSLEKGRRETEAARRSLESTRKRIEAGHDSKQDRYLEVLATTYTAPMQALTPLVQSYVAGINRYSAVMEEYASFCSKSGMTTAAARTFVATLEPEIAALSTEATTLVANAAKVKTADVAARE